MKKLEEKLQEMERKHYKKRRKKIIDYSKVILIVGIVILISVTIYSAWKDSAPIKTDKEYIDFMEDLENDLVEKAQFVRSKKYVNITLKDGEKYSVVDPEYETFKKEILEKGVKIEIVAETAQEAITSAILALPLGIFVLVVASYFTKMLTNSANTLYKLYKNENQIKFANVAGMSETKAEVEFAVTQLRNADKLKDLGAKPCKGIIMEGPPGNGKTLMAKAIAGEAGVPFISTNGSDFIEMFAGLGAARVRKLWELATLNAPCVVFIDEIDSVGRRRTGGGDGAVTEANQTLNELLAKMDGLAPNLGVLVIGATNRIQDLDPALLRPGRFDKKLFIGPPRTKKDRDEILSLYLHTKKLMDDFDFDAASKLVFGLSGAEIEQVANEAVMISLRDNREGIISISDIDEAVMKLISNGVKTSHSSEKDIKICAVHEAGHAVMNSLLGRKVSKISIVPYNSGIGGVTVRDTDDVEDILMKTKEELENDIKVLLAGRMAEKIILGTSSIGCSNDIEKATLIVYNMIYHYNMIKGSIANPDALRKEGLTIIDNENTLDKLNNILIKYDKEVKDTLENHVEDIVALSDKLAEEENIYNYSIKTFGKEQETNQLEESYEPINLEKE